MATPYGNLNKADLVFWLRTAVFGCGPYGGLGISHSLRWRFFSRHNFSVLGFRIDRGQGKSRHDTGRGRGGDGNDAGRHCAA